VPTEARELGGLWRGEICNSYGNIQYAPRRAVCAKSACLPDKSGGVFLTVGEIKEKKEKGKEGEGEKRESLEEMALI